MNLEVSRPSAFAARVLLQRLLPTLALLLAASLAAVPLQGQISQESDQLLHRMYASPDFQVKNFGPARRFRSHLKTTPGPRTRLACSSIRIPRRSGGSTLAEIIGCWTCKLARCANS